MLRSDFRLIGLGGAGGRLVDQIASQDGRFKSFFINSSKTDLESLEHYDDIDKNYILTSIGNGTGRKRDLGKRIIQKNAWNIIDTLQSFDEEVLYFVSSFGGGSGSSSISTLLKGIQTLKKEGQFSKIINLIGILPDLDSKNIILSNTLETWNEIMSYDCINNMMFIDNNNLYNGQRLSENEINIKFASLFDAIFEIPNSNGINFDNGNLSNVLKSKGCMYVYSLPNNSNNVNEALKKSNETSVLARIYKTKDVMIKDDNNDNIEKMKCSYIGTSFNNENYIHEEILEAYNPTEEDYHGYNQENNLVLISGCLPPFYSIQVINTELEDRKRNKTSNTTKNFSKFTIDFSENINTEEPVETESTHSAPKERKTNMKKVMKKNLADIF
jgi:cell division GTPase FtsZ